jgi:hypothetical protein
LSSFISITPPSQSSKLDGMSEEEKIRDDLRRYRERTTKHLHTKRRGKRGPPADFHYHHQQTSAAVDRAEAAQEHRTKEILNVGAIEGEEQATEEDRTRTLAIWGRINAGHIETRFQTTAQRDYSFDYDDPPPCDRTHMSKNPQREYLEAVARGYNFRANLGAVIGQT